VDVLGYVENLTPILIRCRLSIAPLRYGGGIKGKVGTSLSHGLPCVATPTAAEGMGLVDGVNVMIAENAEAFADAVIAAYQDEDLWTRLSTAGIDLMQQEFSFERGLARLKQLIEDIPGSPEAP
jgi:glycosyltransferase involved in cell wall biosynthesis